MEKLLLSQSFCVRFGGVIGFGMSHTHAGRRKDVISTLAHLSEEPEHGGHPKKTTEAEQGCQYNGDWVLLLNFTIRQSLTWHRRP